jgi:hypothetical protein
MWYGLLTLLRVLYCHNSTYGLLPPGCVLVGALLWASRLILVGVVPLCTPLAAADAKNVSAALPLQVG